MATWRRRAAELLPELWADEDDRQKPYVFFFALVPFVRDAHRRDDADALRRGYGFAKWCEQQGGDLRNAAGVAFYEHLFDSWDVHVDVLAWLDDSVAQECCLSGKRASIATSCRFLRRICGHEPFCFA